MSRVRLIEAHQDSRRIASCVRRLADPGTQIKGLVAQKSALTIQARIRQRLTGLGMDAADLARLTKRPRGTVENWLQGRGKGRLPADWVASVARELRVSPRWLLLAEGPVELTEPGEAEVLLEAIRRLVDPAHPGSNEALLAVAEWMNALKTLPPPAPPAGPEAAAGGGAP